MRRSFRGSQTSRPSAEGDDEYAQTVMTANGVPDDINVLLGVLARGLRAYGSPGTVTRPLR